MKVRVRWLTWMWLLTVVACGGASGLHETRVDGGEPVDVVMASEPPPAMSHASWGEGDSGQALEVLTDPGEVPRLEVAGDEERLLPLEHTHVDARLLGFVASVEVSQTYENPFEEPIEVTYVFPLPENSAVGAMEMHIGERVVRAEIDERQAARRRYERAKRRGHTAALLEQERPNVFTQSVANIAPGEKIDVVIRYVQDLSYDAGRYEFVFPMIVGPRFVPGSKVARPQKGKGTYADTDRVPDASRITPPVLGRGERSGHDISIEVVAEAALPIDDYDVPTHEVSAREPADGSLRLALAEKKSIPNRDFVLRYRVAGKEPLATLLTSGQEEGYFSLVVHPPMLDVEELVGRREILFVVDVSGSMSGRPLGMCKTAVRDALSRLRPQDTFNIVTFAGATKKLFPSPRPANRTQLSKALSFLDHARAGGGTHMANAVDEALSPDVAQGRHRYVFFLTDGYIGNEKEIFAGSRQLVKAMEARGQRARVFGYGVGSSVNRHLLEGLSEAGNGIAVYTTSRESSLEAVDRFFRYIDRAVLTDLTVDWGTLGASEIYPSPTPDLFASHPVILHGRYRGELDGPVVVRARAGEKQVRIPVQVHETMPMGERGGIVGALWARSKVEHLQSESWLGQRPNAPAEITELGLRYALVTPYTSFVAVDESRVVGDGDPEEVVQPVEVPEGVDGAMAGARERKPKGLAAKPGSASAGADRAPSSPPAQRAPAPGGGRAPPTEPDAALEEEVAQPSAAPPALERSDRGCYCATPSGGLEGPDRWHGLWLALAGTALVLARRNRAARRRPRA